MKKKIITNIILVVAILVFLYSAYQLIQIFLEYHKGEKEYEQIEEQVITVDKNSEKKDKTEENPVSEDVFRVDFDELLSINKDVVGWIRFDEPKQISYPIALGETNDEYLRTTLKGKKNTAGTIFMDYRNQGDFSDQNTFIYGHNMRNGTMFGQLKKYRDSKFCAEYPDFYIYTPDGKVSTYRVFAVCVVEDTSDSYNLLYTTDQEYEDYLKRAKEMSLYETNVEVTAQSSIISLSTCTNESETQRFLVHAVKVDEKVVGE